MKSSITKIALAVLLSSSTAMALDFGSLAQQAAPAADAMLANTSIGSNPLIKTLTSSLGITPTQALGGSAALFEEAKKDMKPSDFKSMTSKMPAIGSLMSSTPASSSSLSSKFAKYGLKPEMISKFTPFVTDYVAKGTTPDLAKLFQAAIQ